MTIEWLSLSKLAPWGFRGLRALYDGIFGKSPKLNFDTDSGGVELHIFNTRDETIIVERIEAVPPLLAFSEGRELLDIVRAARDQMSGPSLDRPIAVLSPGQRAEIGVLKPRFDEHEDPNKIIRVTAFWRTARRRRFSRSSITVQISVRDIKDLLIEVDRKQPRMSIV